MNLLIRLQDVFEASLKSILGFANWAVYASVRFSTITIFILRRLRTMEMVPLLEEISQSYGFSSLQYSFLRNV